MSDEEVDEEEYEIEEEDSGDPQQLEAHNVLKRMRDSMNDLGEGYELKKARKYLLDTVKIYKGGKYFEIPNREAVFEVILGVAREKFQRAALMEKVRAARSDIKHLHEAGKEVAEMQDTFENITEYIRDKEYETARAKFLSLEFQITAMKKSMGEDVGANPLSNPKVKKVIISDEEVNEEGEVEMLQVLEEVEGEDGSSEEPDNTDSKDEEGEEEDTGLEWEDDDESGDSSSPQKQTSSDDDESGDSSSPQKQASSDDDESGDSSSPGEQVPSDDDSDDEESDDDDDDEDDFVIGDD